MGYLNAGGGGSSEPQVTPSDCATGWGIDVDTAFFRLHVFAGWACEFEHDLLAHIEDGFSRGVA